MNTSIKELSQHLDEIDKINRDVDTKGMIAILTFVVIMAITFIGIAIWN